MPAGSPEQLLAILLDRFPQTVPRGSAPLAIWQELSRRGYVFAGEPTTDEAIALATGDWFHAERFQRLRRGSLGETLESWSVTSSTNDLAFAAAVGGAGTGSVWIAEEQTAGRGRQGRSWLAPRFSALLFSVLLPVDLQASQAPQMLPLALGLGMCEALTGCTGLPIQVRWPNDLLLDGRKLGGMLLEVRGAPPAQVILGAGINVLATLQELADLGLPDAATLAQRSGLDRESILAEVLLGVENRLAQWQRGNFAELLDDWVGHDALQGRLVQVDACSRRLQGQVIGLDCRGLLQLRDAQGTVHSFTSAEVHIL